MCSQDFSISHTKTFTFVSGQKAAFALLVIPYVLPNGGKRLNNKRTTKQEIQENFIKCLEVVNFDCVQVCIFYILYIFSFFRTSMD